MSVEEADCVFSGDIMRFVQSLLGRRMKKAYLSNKLYREQPFVIAGDMQKLQPDWKGGETVLIQGIIDAYFEEDGELVLVDYKTDKVRMGREEHLVELYHTQLEDYADALERMLKKKVKEKYIYSFTLGKAILLP